MRGQINPLREKIIERIRSEGPINFETFMEMALYYPGLGYYSRQSTVIGKHGDFYTGSHLHPIFGALIGRQMVEFWMILEESYFHLVEMGVGEGYLASDMLDYLRTFWPDFFNKLTYTIIEKNPSVKARQERLLSDFSGVIKWVGDINDLEFFEGCFFSNELLDSFPVRLIVMDEDLKEVFVSIDSDANLIEIKRDCSPEVREYIEEFNIKLQEGYRTEVNLRIRDWLVKAYNRLKDGFVMTIDYGYSALDYYGEGRDRGTLLCYHNHRVEDNPFKHIGDQDITAHVNFSSLKKWGEDLGIKTIGFCEQGPYLVSLGIDEVIKDLYGESPDPFDIAKIKGLFLPEGMGETHKVMIQYKGNRNAGELRGFNLRNRLNWL